MVRMVLSRSRFWGPADSDVRYLMKQDFMEETGLDMPEGYELEEE